MKEIHAGGGTPGAVLVKTEEEIVRRGLVVAKRSLDNSAANHTPVIRKRRKKITRVLDDAEPDDMDWKEATPDSHAGEEFWVDGRE